MGNTIRITGDGDRYVGKHMLVGITWQTEQGEQVRKEAFHGHIVEASDACIIIKRADTRGRVSLPPELEEARSGRYQLPNDVVEDPDYVAKWRFDERLWNHVMLDDSTTGGSGAPRSR